MLSLKAPQALFISFHFLTFLKTWKWAMSALSGSKSVVIVRYELPRNSGHSVQRAIAFSDPATSYHGNYLRLCSFVHTWQGAHFLGMTQNVYNLIFFKNEVRAWWLNTKIKKKKLDSGNAALVSKPNKNSCLWLWTSASALTEFV